MLLSSEIIKIQRDRLVLAQFRRKFHADMAAFAFRLALLRASLTQKELQHRAGFNPAQARDPNGQWTAGGASSSAHDATASVPDKTLLDEGEQDQSPADPRLHLAAGSADADYTVDLQQQDALGGHGFRDHVAQSPKVLVDEVEAKARRARNPSPDGWAEGSFTDKYNANYLVNRVLRNNKEMVDLVRSGQIPELLLRERMGFVTGYEAYKATRDSTADIRLTYGVRVLIRPSRQSPTGYYVHTAFPMNMGHGGQ